jgi:hypothetical protein
MPRFLASTSNRIKGNRIELAAAAGPLDRLVVFGSYVSDVAEPNDVDVILVMRDEFCLESCPAASLVLFDQTRADAELKASVFWVRPGMLLGEPLEQRGGGGD